MTRRDPPGGRAAVFLDRDGTLIADRGPLLDPGALELLPGVPAALRKLAAEGYARIVITNQSAIGRGWLDVAGLERIHAALRAQLTAEGADIEAIYFCPDAPAPAGAPERPADRRKPGAGMLIEAARDHGLDLARCWMVGDQARDTLAGRRAGCRGTLLLRTGQGPAFADRRDAFDEVVDDLPAAVEWILAADRAGHNGAKD